MQHKCVFIKGLKIEISKAFSWKLYLHWKSFCQTFSKFIHQGRDATIDANEFNRVVCVALIAIQRRFFSVRLLSVLRGHSFFFHPRQNGQWPPTSKDFLSQILSITFIFLSYFLRKSQYFPFWMFSAKQENYWYHFHNVFGMSQSLTEDWTQDLPHSKSALYH